jgi:hypothetical protein
MDHFAGLDVSVKETSVCIVDDTGKIVREVKVASEPEALLAVLKNPAYRFKRIGLEAGPLSQWLYSALAEAELTVVCVETRPGGAEGAGQQDGPQRCARHGADDAGGALPPGAYQDVTQSETADAADPSPTASVEGDRHPLSCGASCSEREAAAGSAEHELLGNLFFGQIDEVLAAAMHRHYICKIELPEL